MFLRHRAVTHWIPMATAGVSSATSSDITSRWPSSLRYSSGWRRANRRQTDLLSTCSSDNPPVIGKLEYLPARFLLLLLVLLVPLMMGVEKSGWSDCLPLLLLLLSARWFSLGGDPTTAESITILPLRLFLRFVWRFFTLPLLPAIGGSKAGAIVFLISMSSSLLPATRLFEGELDIWYAMIDCK